MADLEFREVQLDLAASLLRDAAHAVPEGRTMPLLDCETLTGVGARIARAMCALDLAQEALAASAREIADIIDDLARSAHESDLALSRRAPQRTVQ